MTYVNKVLAWQPISQNDNVCTPQIQFFLQKYLAAMSGIRHMNGLNHMQNCNQSRISYRPMCEINREHMGKVRHNEDQVATIHDMVNFVKACAETVNAQCSARKLWPAPKVPILSLEVTERLRLPPRVPTLQRRSNQRHGIETSMLQWNVASVRKNMIWITVWNSWIYSWMRNALFWSRCVSRITVWAISQKGCLCKCACCKCNKWHPTAMDTITFSSSYQDSAAGKQDPNVSPSSMTTNTCHLAST